jgi:hypothetical protein
MAQKFAQGEVNPIPATCSIPFCCQKPLSPKSSSCRCMFNIGQAGKRWSIRSGGGLVLFGKIIFKFQMIQTQQTVVWLLEYRFRIIETDL